MPDERRAAVDEREQALSVRVALDEVVRRAGVLLCCERQGRA